MTIVDYLRNYRDYEVEFIYYFYFYNCKKKLIAICDDEYSYIGYADYFQNDHAQYYDCVSDIDIDDCDVIIDESRNLLVIEFVSSFMPDSYDYPYQTMMDEKWGC